MRRMVVMVMLSEYWYYLPRRVALIQGNGKPVHFLMEPFQFRSLSSQQLVPWPFNVCWYICIVNSQKIKPLILLSFAKLPLQNLSSALLRKLFFSFLVLGTEPRTLSSMLGKYFYHKATSPALKFFLHKLKKNFFLMESNFSKLPFLNSLQVFRDCK